MNAIKQSGVDGLALQVTKAARAAGLVEETNDGETTRRAVVRVYAVDNLLLVFDIERVDGEHMAELVASAVRDTNSIGRGMDATVVHAGNGYAVQLPPAEDAGFVEGMKAGTHTAPGLLVISKGKGAGAADAARLGKDLVTQRRSQVE